MKHLLILTEAVQRDNSFLLGLVCGLAAVAAGVFIFKSTSKKKKE